MSGKEGVQVFNADQLSEFGYMEGPKYKAKMIHTGTDYEKVFLEVLEEGKVDFLHLTAGRKNYFLEGDSLVKLEKENYQDILKAYSGYCKKLDEQYKLVSFNKRSLKNHIRNVNQNECRNVPFLSFGPLVGFSINKLSLSGNYFPRPEEDLYSFRSTNLSVGFFVETPVFELENLSFLSDLQYGKQQFIGEFFFRDANQDIRMEMDYLNFNLAPKYTLDSEQYRPYFFLGGNVSYNLKSSDEVFQAVKEEKVIWFEKFQNSLNLPKYFLGLSAGAGIQVFYRYDQYISLEFSNRRLFSDRAVTMENYHFCIKANL